MVWPFSRQAGSERWRPGEVSIDEEHRRWYADVVFEKLEDRYLRQQLAGLELQLLCLADPRKDWQLCKLYISRGVSVRELYDELDRLFTTIWDMVVNYARPLVTRNPAAGDEATRLIRGSKEVREAWPAILSSGFFDHDDDRLPTVELFMLAGAFPYEDDDSAGEH